jgi:hypothetical protein
MIKEGWQLAYQTPMLGYPWTIPLEFPFYQLIVFHAGFSLDAGWRAVSCSKRSSSMNSATYQREPDKAAVASADQFIMVERDQAARPKVPARRPSKRRRIARRRARK